MWVLDYLDSRHADVRAEGWAWLLDEPRARDHVDIWQRLLESPYDDVRLKLIDYLEQQVAGRDTVLPARLPLDANLLRLLWASVLLNIHRGGRKKPLVVQQVVARLASHPDEADQLLPILKVALRSVRGPEWRAGLAGLVGLLQRRGDLEPLVKQHFPELTLAEAQSA
jgi:hypothetical protein